MHKIVQHPAKPERLFLQNHWGLYRSDDAGNSWTDIANGVPSDFGFCMAIHPHDPDMVYAVPIESDQYRCTPEGKLRVYCTRNAGASWQPLTRGLPQKNAMETILRDALTTDTCKPAGIYFGTRSGKVYGSSDDGKSWQILIEGLPPVVCVRAALVGEGAKHSPRRRGGAEKTKARAKKSLEEDAIEASAGEARDNKAEHERRRDKPMAVTVRIPSYLASFADGKSSIALDGSPATVSDALRITLAASSWPAGQNSG